MIDYVLQITLQSPLTSAAGEGRVGVVDQDVAFDGLGLPILPGRCLKGLWREAYRDVFDAGQLCGKSLIPVEAIFGKLGQATGTADVRLHIENAELKEASSLKPWLAYLQHPEERKLYLEEVVRHFAIVRPQTAIDRRTGAADENTLRLTRTLQSGLVFYAPVRLFTPPDKDLLNALALGAAALQHMGIARTRGLGKVFCRLRELDANGQPGFDLTKQALNSGALPSITAQKLKKTSESKATPIPCLNSISSTHLLRYRLTLKEPVVIPAVDGDPNTVVTRQDVPGSNVWGAAAWHYLHQTGHTPGDKDFQYAFLDGALRFLTAYLEGYNPEAAGEKPQRLIPIPHAIRKYKDNETLVNFVEQPPESWDRQTKRHNLRYARIREGQLETRVVKTERSYHHARAGTKSGGRSIGRALGNDVEDGGALFQYEAIKGNQSFQGAVLGPEEDLQNLQKWLPKGSLIHIGRSRSAQYGEAEFKWIDSVPQDLSQIPSEWDGFVAQQTPIQQHVPEDPDCLVIITLSPLLTVNGYGHPEACFPEHELATVLGLDTSAKKLTLSCSYTRTELVGGYNGHLCLPRQQWPAIAAGSVFVFDTKEVQNCITKDLLQLEREGLGLRKGEGYGRIAINRLKLSDFQEKQLGDLERELFPDESSLPDSNVQKLLQGVVRTRCLAKMLQLAITAAEGAKNIPSNALLGRLRLFLQLDPLTAVENLSNLRDLPKKKLEDCKITSEGETLYDLFKRNWIDPNSFVKKLAEEQVEELLVEERYTTTRNAITEELVKTDGNEMCKEFLNQLLTALHRKSRT